MIGALITKRKVAAAFDALNRHDLDVFLKGWRDDATFIYPGNIPASGAYTGKDAIRAWFQNLLDQYPTIEFTVKRVAVSNPFDLTGNTVAMAEWDIKETNRDGFSAENSGVTVITLRWGKAVRIKDYLFDTGEEWRKSWGAQ